MCMEEQKQICNICLEYSRMKAYRAKKAADLDIQGTYEKQYAVLWDYGVEIKRSNPGSTVEFDCDVDHEGNRVFKRVYICYEGCKSGFRSCRPVIGVDGCHIKGHHTGQLLTAIEIDANNSMFPIAFAVVESEGKST